MIHILMRSARLLGCLLLATSTAGIAHADVMPSGCRSALKTIERVRYSYQLGRTLLFEQAFTPQHFDNLARELEMKSAALELYWNVRVTKQMLDDERNRIESNTRMPERLRRIYFALNNDKERIEGCYVRTLLVDRLARELFAYDPRIHARARTRAERLHRQLVTHAISAYADNPDRIVGQITLQSDPRSTAQGPPDSIPAFHNDRFDMLGARVGLKDFERIRLHLPKVVGDVGPVVEMPDRFLIQVPLEIISNRMHIANYLFRKRDWSEWWNEVFGQLDSQSLRTIRGDNPSADIETVEHGQHSAAYGLRHSEEDISSQGSTPSCSVDDTWTVVAATPNSPSPREGHTSVWTGNVVLVWGGAEFVGDVQFLTDTGGRYDPVVDAWTPISTTNAPSARFLHTAVWTGARMIVWGGDGPGPMGTGGLYDPVSDTWSSTSLANAPSSRSSHSSIWTGDEMIVWGGVVSSGSQDSGGRYDPSTDSWSPTALANAPQARFFHTAIWTGSEMIVWGGEVPNTGGITVNSGSRYDPTTDSWASTSLQNAPDARELHTAVWTGTKMIVWGGGASIIAHLDTGGVYDPISDAWGTTSLVNAPAPRSRHTADWDGSQMTIWGGQAGTFFSPVFFDTGARYVPETDTWFVMTTNNNPDPRSKHTAVRTSETMFVWGGADRFTNFEDGGEYCTCTMSVFYADIDSDTIGDSNTTASACIQPPGYVSIDGDCDDSNGTVWSVPSEVQDLRLMNNLTISWSPPSNPGGTTPEYDLLRSGDPADFFSTAVCVETNSQVTTSTDADTPPLGTTFVYLSRAETDCPGGEEGPLGFSSDGTPRSGRSCP